MYAVIETGSKQYKITEGEIVPVERLALDKDADVLFDKVLLVVDGADVAIGEPYLTGVSVVGKVVEEQKDKKVLVYKYKQKTGYKRKQGHRQIYTLVKIEKIKK